MRSYLDEDTGENVALKGEETGIAEIDDREPLGWGSLVERTRGGSSLTG
jgi:hypothetical protein